MNKKRQIVIICIIGFLTLAISVFLAFLKSTTETPQWYSNFAYEAVFEIGFVLVGVFLTDIVWNLVGGDPSEQYQKMLMNSNTLLGDAMRTGLIGIVAASNEMGTSQDWLNILKDAKKEVFLQGYTLLIWTRSDSFRETLLRLAKNGVRIRLLFMDENAQYLKVGVNDRQISELTVANVQQEIQSMTTYMDAVLSDFAAIHNRRVKGSIEYKKLKDGLISSQIVRVDDKLFVTPYLSAVNTSHCPLYKIQGEKAPLFHKYVNDFEHMWIFDNTTS